MYINNCHYLVEYKDSEERTTIYIHTHTWLLIPTVRNTLLPLNLLNEFHPIKAFHWKLFEWTGIKLLYDRASWIPAHKRPDYVCTWMHTHLMYAHVQTNDWSISTQTGANLLLMFSMKEGNGFFNDTLNTFYLWLYGVRHMVKDYSDSEIHGYSFCLAARGIFYIHQSWSTGWNKM